MGPTGWARDAAEKLMDATRGMEYGGNVSIYEKYI